MTSYLIKNNESQLKTSKQATKTTGLEGGGNKNREKEAKRKRKKQATE